MNMNTMLQVYTKYNNSFLSDGDKFRFDNKSVQVSSMTLRIAEPKNWSLPSPVS